VSWSYNLAETAAAQWRMLGIDVRITYADYRTMLTLLESNDTYDLWSLAWEMPGIATPDLLFGSDAFLARYNFGDYSNPEADAIFNALNQVNTEEDRKALFDQWHAIFLEDLPLLPVSQLKKQWVFEKRLSQISVNAMQNLGDVIRQIEFGGRP
jgi:oligopeptide transport system substrate-binding protein